MRVYKANDVLILQVYLIGLGSPTSGASSLIPPVMLSRVRTDLALVSSTTTFRRWRARGVGTGPV